MGERMRSTTFALFGLGTLCGLTMVAIMAQQSFSILPALPIPGIASPGEAVSRASVAAGSVDSAPAAIRSAVPAAGPDSRSTVAGGPDRPTVHLAGSRESRPAQTPPAPDPATPVETGSPPAPAPAPVSTPAQTQPTAVSAAPVDAASGGSQPGATPVAAAGPGVSKGQGQGHRPAPTSPAHGHRGRSPSPPAQAPGQGGTEPESEPVIPAEDTGGPGSGNGPDQGHGHGDEHGSGHGPSHD